MTELKIFFILSQENEKATDAKPNLKIDVDEGPEDGMNWADLCKTPDVNDAEEQSFLPLDESIFASSSNVNTASADQENPSSVPEEPVASATVKSDPGDEVEGKKSDAVVTGKELPQGDGGSCDSEQVLDLHSSDNFVEVSDGKTNEDKEGSENDILRKSQQVLEERLRVAAEASKKHVASDAKEKSQKSGRDVDGAVKEVEKSDKPVDSSGSSKGKDDMTESSAGEGDAAMMIEDKTTKEEEDAQLPANSEVSNKFENCSVQSSQVSCDNERLEAHVDVSELENGTYPEVENLVGENLAIISNVEIAEVAEAKANMGCNIVRDLGQGSEVNTDHKSSEARTNIIDGKIEAGLTAGISQLQNELSQNVDVDANNGGSEVTFGNRETQKNIDSDIENSSTRLNTDNDRSETATKINDNERPEVKIGDRETDRADTESSAARVISTDNERSEATSDIIDNGKSETVLDDTETKTATFSNVGSDSVRIEAGQRPSRSEATAEILLNEGSETVLEDSEKNANNSLNAERSSAPVSPSNKSSEIVANSSDNDRSEVVSDKRGATNISELNSNSSSVRVSSDNKRSEATATEVKDTNTNQNFEASRANRGSERSSRQVPQNEGGTYQRRVKRSNETAYSEVKSLPNEDRQRWIHTQLQGLQDSVLDNRNARYFVIEATKNALVRAFSTKRFLVVSMDAVREALTMQARNPVVLFMVLRTPNGDCRLCAIAVAISEPYSFDVRNKAGEWRVVEIFDLRFLCKAKSHNLLDRSYRHQEELRRAIANRILGGYAKSIKTGLIDKLMDEERWENNVS